MRVGALSCHKSRVIQDRLNLLESHLSRPLQNLVDPLAFPAHGDLRDDTINSITRQSDVLVQDIASPSGVTINDSV